jgi:hypothetical protein
VLIDRLASEGLFNLFCEQVDSPTRYKFGREPNGSPALPWRWDDLDLTGHKQFPASAPCSTTRFSWAYAPRRASASSLDWRSITPLLSQDAIWA